MHAVRYAKQRKSRAMTQLEKNGTSAGRKLLDETAATAAPRLDVDRRFAFQLHAHPDALLRLAFDPRADSARAVSVIKHPALLH